MALTESSTISALLQAALQSKILEPLRAQLVFANKAWAEMGSFQPGADIIKFASYADLAVATTPLTEGTPPTAVALAPSTTQIAATQFGNLVDVTDLAKVKSPHDLASLGMERLARNAAETIDQLARDEIAAGGTFFPQEVGDANRAAVDSGDLVTASSLRRLRAKMFKSKVPLAGRHYFLLISPDVGFDIRNEGTSGNGNWIDVNKYTEPSIIKDGEIGTMEGFRIIEVVNAPTFSSSVLVHASIAFGSLPGWGWGDLQSLSAYDVPPGGDHSDPLAQSHKMGWKVDFGVASLSNARYFRLESAATAI
jgi:N4-gp56 family major capsid protein